MKNLMLALVCLLASCAPTVTHAPLLMVTAQGAAQHPRIAYQLVPAAALPAGVEGQARVLGSVCLVSIREDSVNAMTIAHEVGHCVDGGRSAGFGQAGCVLRPYACDPAEGFADTFALLYRLRYGNRLDVLGWPGTRPTTDPLPDPDEVTPALLPRLIDQLTDLFNQQR